MKLKLKTTPKRTPPPWPQNEFGQFLLAPITEHRRDFFRARFERVFGKPAPKNATAIGLRTAIFYEQLVREKVHAGEKVDDRLLQRHKEAMEFKIFKYSTYGEDSIPRIIQHRCGHARPIQCSDADALRWEKRACLDCNPEPLKKPPSKLRQPRKRQPPTAPPKREEEKKKGATRMARKAAAATTEVGKGIAGKSTGLNKTQYIIKMLKENQKGKKSDDELAKMFAKEFPDTKQYPISGLRSKLNRGGFGDVGFASVQFEGGKPVKNGAGKADMKEKMAALRAKRGGGTAAAAPPEKTGKKLRLKK